MVVAFKHLGRILTASNNNWPVVVANLQKSRKCWDQLSQIIEQERADPQTSGIFYKAVVQVALLFGVETWVVSPRIVKTLGGLHHILSCRLAVMRPRWDATCRWV